jgi:hypothetical protein
MEWIEIPDPPDVKQVEDETGRRYTRTTSAGEYWQSSRLGPGRGNYAWHDLLYQRGPVRPVKE